MLRYALTLIAYAVCVGILGFLTYSLAPEGASAMTALFVTGVIAILSIACGVLSLLINSNRLLGMIGIHVGLLIPLLGVVGSVARIGGSIENANAGNTQIAHLERELREHRGQQTPIVLRQRTGEGESGWEVVVPGGAQIPMEDVLEPKAYQTVGIGGTALLSAFAFVALLLHRPKLPPKPVTA